MKRFIEKTSKIYVFEFDEIFPAYKQICELMGGKNDISMNYSPLDGGNITVMASEKDTIRIYSAQALLIRNGKMSSVGITALVQDYEEISKEVIVVKHIFNDSPLTNPLNPFTERPFPHIPSQPFYPT